MSTNKIKNGQKLQPRGPHLELLDYYISSAANDGVPTHHVGAAWYRCRLTGETYTVHLDEYGKARGGYRACVFDLLPVWLEDRWTIVELSQGVRTPLPLRS